jgi:aminoglycoside phosphotransferase (APT) family kinase protein
MAQTVGHPGSCFLAFETVPPGLARRLIDDQFPQWAGRPLRLLEPAGSDHVIYRLGDDLSVRLPRHSGAIGQAAKELYWLPRLAPHLPLTIPSPVAVGRPGFGYPWSWGVSRWLEGEVATVEALGDSIETAVELAAFLTALRHFLPPVPPAGTDPSAGSELSAVTAPEPSAASAIEPPVVVALEPPAGTAPEPSAGIGVGTGAGSAAAILTGRPLTERDASTRASIARIGNAFDAAAITAVWDAAVHAPEWNQAPTWYHGDFHTGNLLTVDGRLSAVIDFGGLGRGDPARDLMMAFTLMSSRSRAAFREALGVDDASWARGRGWALVGGLNAYVAYAATNPRVAEQTTRQIRAALAG